MAAKASPRGPAGKKETEPIPLRRVLAAIFRRKWLIVNVTVAGLLAGIVVSIFINPVNVWRGYIPVSVRSPGRLIASVLEGAPPGGREEFTLADEIQYWLSDRVIEETAKACGLPAQQKEIHQKESQTLRYRILAWLEERLRGILPSPEATESDTFDEEARYLNAAKRHLMGEIEIGRSQMRPQDASSYYIEISYRNPEYPKVREVLETLVAKFQDYRKLQVKTGLQEKIQEILQKQHKKEEKEKKELEARLSVKYKELGLMPGSDFNAIVEDLRSSLRENRARLDRLKDERRRVALQLEVAERSRENLLSQKEDRILLPTQGLGQERSKEEVLFEAMVRKLVDLELELKNPGLRSSERAEKQAQYDVLKADIESFKKERRTPGEIQSMRSPEMARLETEISTHKAILAGLDDDIGEIKKQVALASKQLAEAQAQVVQANKIRQEYEAAAARLERIEQQIEFQVASTEAQDSIAYVTAHDVRMDPTPVPLHKFGRKVLLLLATLMGLGLGTALALGLEMIDSSLNSVDELEEKVGLPVLASIQEYRKVRLIPRQG